MNRQSDYLLQKNPDRATLYAMGGIWWSRELKRWMVTDVHLLKQILNDTAFSVPRYDSGNITERLNIDLRHIATLSKHLPLAVEGEPHRKLRAKFAKEISKNTPRAVLSFETEFSARLDTLLSLTNGKQFCLVTDLLQPSLRVAMMHLAGIGHCQVDRIELIPQLFDDSISLRKRLEIDSIIGSIIDALPGAMSLDEKYFRTTIVALGANTLLGSISQSIINIISRGHNSRLCNLEWDSEFPETSLALIEKYATRDTTIAGCHIRTGDRLRLFLDAAGHRNQKISSYSDLFFASGPHRCPGMSFSRQIWTIVSKYLSDAPKILTVVNAQYRNNDNVFNFYERIEAEFHE